MLLINRFTYRWRIIRVITRRRVQQYKRRMDKYWNSQSGEWTWLADKPMPVVAINRRLWRLSVPSLSFHLLLGLSGIIATLGLLSDSVAIIIGAMIIAPLMGPIIGMAYSISMGNRRLLRRSSLTLLTGILWTILLASITCAVIGLKTTNPEILSRTTPSLLDLGVALAAGTAGAFATSRRHIADALPGVAIAVALVPPLSVVGIGIAWGQQPLFMGAFLLFATNLISIVFSGALVFLLQRYGNLTKAKQGLLISIILLSVLGIPLGFQMRNLLIQENVRQSVAKLIRYQTLTFSDTDIRLIRVRPQYQYLFVELEVASELDSISENQINLVTDFLSQELQQPVMLEVTIVPVKVFKSKPFEP